MLKRLISLVALCCSCTVSANSEHNYRVVFAMDLIRHGDRTPSISLTKDTHQWSEGLNQLTPQGIKALQQLGNNLREYYVVNKKLLPADSQAYFLKIRSTGYKRCMVSAEALLLGMYPPETQAQMISIETVPMDQDSLLLPSEVQKQPFQALLKTAVYAQPIWLAKENQYKEKLLYWSNVTGYKMQHLKDIISLGDLLYIRQLHHFPLFPGLNQSDTDDIIELAQWVLVNKFKPKEVGNFIAVNVLAELKKQVIATINKQSQLRYIAYIGHDSTILGLMSAIGVPLKTPPPYGADLRFELLQDKNKHYWIRTTYNNQLQKLSGCDELCSLEQFFAR